MSRLFRRSFSYREPSDKFSDLGNRQNSDISSLHGLESISISDKKFRKRVSNPLGDSVSRNLESQFQVTGGTSGSELRRHRRKSIIGALRPNSNQQNLNTSSHKELAPSISEKMDSDRSRTRRERTFVGSECAVCEEPLEHTLRGERVLQFSCGHVSHEACFYEHIKEFESQYCPSCNAPLGLDTSRGGNVLDIEKLSNIVRSVSASEQQKLSQSSANTWDNQQPARPSSRDSYSRHTNRDSRPLDNHDGRDRSVRQSTLPKIGHLRHNSDNPHSPSVAYSETAVSVSQGRYDYDRQISELGVTSPALSSLRNPIPSPNVVVRPEFPSLNRSREQQSLTCIVTIEVPNLNWKPNPEDLRRIPSPTPPEESYTRPPSPAHSAPRQYSYHSPEELLEITDKLRIRVENWHGLDFSRFGKLRLYGKIRVGKDKISWQELECFLFAEMLVCVKEKKITLPPQWDDPKSVQKATRCTLKGSILIKKHLNEVSRSSLGDENVLTLSLSVAELPFFHLRFENANDLKVWQHALLGLNSPDGTVVRSSDYENLHHEEEVWQEVTNAIIPQRISGSQSNGGTRSANTANPENINNQKTIRPTVTSHVPLDIVVVVPITSSMQGVKINLVRDALNFIVQNLDERDRMGVVTFGSSSGATPLVGMRSSVWNGWNEALASIRPVGQKNLRADVVEGANVAMDLLMQRKFNNPIATIFLISDSSTTDQEAVDFVVSRAEAAKIGIYSFGLGMTHKPDTMVELSTRTKASYLYVKDWMMLRECLAGCLGAMQSVSHQNVKLKLRLPEGSPAKFLKISGALQTIKRATGKDAEASLGDLRFGDKRDILVQLIIMPDQDSQEQVPQDPWESIVSGLEALGGPDKEEERALSVEEVPLIQADLSWGDILRDGTVSHLPRPSLLAITMFPIPTSQEKKTSSHPSGSPPIPPLPNVVQRRMELLTADMLNRALCLVTRGQHERAQHLLSETRSILKGLAKGSLPPIPPSSTGKPLKSSENNQPHLTESNGGISPNSNSNSSRVSPQINASGTGIGSSLSDAYSVTSSAGIDSNIVSPLDVELEASLEWIGHPAVFSRDSRKAIFQAIGVISSQRGYTFRTPIETSWASRIRGVKIMTERSKEWREEVGGEGGIMEEI
ncbi:putative vwa-like protein [Erysiphe neolycopersici]|uniref:Putative vwa-like protein n=1 Tax=Erysiphe neolycopersici TaxID=212602 RepID=A0A420HVA0_9PEZI|nr:putative vwa-like protein [Erysiphe neolycopersici]